MRLLVIIVILLGAAQLAVGQSTVRMKLNNDQTIKGEWMGMEQNQYLVRQENGTVLYVPAMMVYKLKLNRSFKEFPRYDENRNAFFYGWSGEFNTTTGQKNQNFNGTGISGLIGYDWDHRYSLAFTTGYRNMNIGQPETFVPMTLTAKRYLTNGRYLVFAGVEAGYQWGVRNKWHLSNTQSNWNSFDPRFSWQQPPHERGGGPSVAPLAGVRKIGKFGWDHVFSMGLHFQKFESDQLHDDDNFSRVEILYKRWRVSYGMIF